MRPLKPAELPMEVKLQRIISIAEAAQLRCVSPDTFKRLHSNLIVKLSERRRGVRLKDVLALSEDNKPAA